MLCQTDRSEVVSKALAHVVTGKFPYWWVSPLARVEGKIGECKFTDQIDTTSESNVNINVPGSFSRAVEMSTGPSLIVTRQTSHAAHSFN